MRYLHASVLLFLWCFIEFPTDAQDIGALKNSKKFEVNGQFGLSGVFYDVHGRPANRPSFSWMMVGNPVVSIYGITLPFSFTISEQHRSFQQPFNKIGVSPYYKWARLHLGYRNISFSRYTLGGHTILGAGGEFTPGKFRIGIMAGRLMKPVYINPAIPMPSTHEIPAYKRNALAFRLGYGTPDNYLDLVLFRANDVNSSIIDTGMLAVPSSNAVFSVVTHQKFLKHFVVDLEFANSILTMDKRVEGEPGDKLPPLYPSLISRNASTISSNAIEAAIGYDRKIFDLKLKFRQLDPGFKSLGTWFLQNNLRNITIEPAVNFSEGRYLISSSVGFQRDNLKNSLARQTNRVIGSVRFSGAPVKWYKADLSYSNYDISQAAGFNPLDTLNEISQTTQNIQVMQNFNVVKGNTSHNLMLSLNDQIMTDRANKGTSYKSITSMGSYVIGYMPWRMNVSFTYTFCHFDLPGNDNKTYGPAVSWSASLLKGSLNTSVSWAGFKTNINDNSAGKINIYTLNASWKIKKKHVAKLRIYLNDGVVNMPYTETKAELGYAFIF